MIVGVRLFWYTRFRPPALCWEIAVAKSDVDIRILSGSSEVAVYAHAYVVHILPNVLINVHRLPQYPEQNC